MTITDQPLSSSPCMMGETDPAYHGFYSRDELLILLYDLLHRQRASVRVCALSRRAATAEQRRLLRAIYRHSANACRQLSASLHSLGATEDKILGDVLDQCIATDDINQRLQLLHNEQHRIARSITETLPRIQQQQVQRQLADMLESLHSTINLLEHC